MKPTKANLTKITNRLSDDDKKALLSTFKAAAIATAVFWDSLSTIVEHPFNIELDGAGFAIESLAADCGTDPTTTNFDNLTVADILTLCTYEDLTSKGGR